MTVAWMMVAAMAMFLGTSGLGLFSHRSNAEDGGGECVGGSSCLCAEVQGLVRWCSVACLLSTRSGEGLELK